MQARMKNPAMIVPNAIEALQALGKCAEQGAVPSRTLGLVHLRASQINGCSVCVDMQPSLTQKRRRNSPAPVRRGGVAGCALLHGRRTRRLGAHRTVTRLSDRADPVPDEVWDQAARHYDEPALASLMLAIATINVWNRLNVATRQVAGEWANSAEARQWVESGALAR